MIPIRDENPSGTVPVVTVALIGLNVLVFLYEKSLSEGAFRGFIYTFGLVPASAWSLAGAELEPALEAVVERSGPPVLTVFTSMFLHGGVMHVLGNMWFLWLFGDNIEDRLGHVGFILFYLVCGVGASAAHVRFAGPSTMPMVGASGAIAGVLGAYLVCFPRARVLTIVPFFFLFFVRLPAYFFLLMWLFGQVSGVLSPDEMGIAWWAHIGGFALGAGLALFWPKCASAKQSAYEAKPDVWRARRRG